MATLRPSKDLRSTSMIDPSSSLTSSKRPLPTPFLRHPSVVEVMEKKQREGLKNRLKMLHTGGVLPSRNSTAVSSNLPVIVKAPVRKATLPKNPPRKAHYTSVLNLAMDPGTSTEVEQSRLTRRHSIGGGLMCNYRDRQRSSSVTNGTDFKSDNFLNERLSGSRYKTTNSNNKRTSEPDSKSRAKFQIAKDDSNLDKESTIITFLPISKTQSQILTHGTEAEDGLEDALNSDARMNGDYKKHDNEDDVFSLLSNEGKLDDKPNTKQSSRDDDLKYKTEKPDIDRVVNGRQESAAKPDRIGVDIVVETTKMSYHTASERPRVTEDFWMSELQHSHGNRETRNDEIKEPPSLLSTGLESLILVDANDSSSETSSQKHDADDETRSEKLQPHNNPATALLDFGHSNIAETETRTPFTIVENHKKVEERPSLYEESKNAFDDHAISRINVLTTNGENDFSNDLVELNKTDYKSKDETDNFWSSIEDSFSRPVQAIASKSHSELIELKIPKSMDPLISEYDVLDDSKETSNKNEMSTGRANDLWPTSEDLLGIPVKTSNNSYAEPFDAGAHKFFDVGPDKHSVFDEFKEPNKSDNESLGQSEVLIDFLTGPIETPSNRSPYESISPKMAVHSSPDSGLGFSLPDISDDSQETIKNDDKSKNKSDAVWSAFEDLLTGPVQTPNKSYSESIGVGGVQKYPDTGFSRRHFSDDLLEPDKNDDKGKEKADDFRSPIEDSFIGSVETTDNRSRSELIEVEIQKCPDNGLGFCIEGGKGTLQGDRPITVKRVFNEATHRCLKEGDEILTVANQDTSTLTHIDAWRLFKSLPDGSVKMTVIRRKD